MRLKQIIEDIHIAGDWDNVSKDIDGYVWTLRDKRFVNNPNLRQKLVQTFPRFEDFQIFFIQNKGRISPDGRRIPLSEVNATSLKEARIDDEIAEFILSKIDSTKTNIVLATNNASEWVPFTSWMIMHRCIHAMFNLWTWNSVKDSFARMFYAIEMGYYDDTNEEHMYKLFLDDTNFFVKDIGPFLDITSINKGMVKRDGEIIIEAVTYWAKHGRLKFHTPETYFGKKLKYKSAHLYEMEEFNKLFSEKCERMFSNAKGNLSIL
jgi:hypothetical protein